MSAVIIDIADDPTPKLAAIKASGVTTIFGYLSSINPAGGKCLTPARMRAITAAGLRAGLVHEGWGGVGGRGISAADGRRDGGYCRQIAPTLGAPRHACIYFACDTDFRTAQIETLVLPYFREIRATFGDGYYRVGVYGSGAVCAAVMAAKLADLSWLSQSKGWTGYSQWLVRAALVQEPETRLSGLDVDTDSAQADIGDFVPFTPLPAAPVSDRVSAASEPVTAVTSSQYAAAAAAALVVLKAEVDAEVPAFFRGDISDAMLRTLAERASKAAIDAAAGLATATPPSQQQVS